MRRASPLAGRTEGHDRGVEVAGLGGGDETERGVLLDCVRGAEVDRERETSA